MRIVVFEGSREELEAATRAHLLPPSLKDMGDVSIAGPANEITKPETRDLEPVTEDVRRMAIIRYALTHAPLRHSHKALFRALIEANSGWVSAEKLSERMKEFGNHGALWGVLGSLGRRMTSSPDYVNTGEAPINSLLDVKHTAQGYIYHMPELTRSIIESEGLLA